MTDKSWISHVEWAVMMVTIIGAFYLFDGKIERQAARTDRLYEMFVDLLKEMNHERR